MGKAERIRKTCVKIYNRAKKMRSNKPEKDYLKLVLLTKSPYYVVMIKETGPSSWRADDSQVEWVIKENQYYYPNYRRWLSRHLGHRARYYV